MLTSLCLCSCDISGNSLTHPVGTLKNHFPGPSSITTEAIDPSTRLKLKRLSKHNANAPLGVVSMSICLPSCHTSCGNEIYDAVFKVEVTSLITGSHLSQKKIEEPLWSDSVSCEDRRIRQVNRRGQVVRGRMKTGVAEEKCFQFCIKDLLLGFKQVVLVSW